ncbi:hypothetical protein [Nitrosopumilus maritimus]|uniref:hypothetical protein n=1 Tax=Nitrosopumilus maritimus TaxID=338192 RepID=UPI000159A836|nr:hypothetical protein [Nitrosopumilus maritimus]
MLKSLIIPTFLFLLVFAIGMVSMVEAHPHATPELMNSHSHNMDDENFQEEFFLHDFEHVIISFVDFISGILVV